LLIVRNWASWSDRSFIWGGCRGWK